MIASLISMNHPQREDGSENDSPASKRAKLARQSSGTAPAMTPAAHVDTRFQHLTVNVVLDVAADGSVATALSVTKLSKAARKAARRTARYEIQRSQRPQKRAAYKARARQRREAAKLDGSLDTRLPHQRARGAKLRAMIRELTETAPRILIDLSDEALMIDEEVFSLAKQIRFLYVENLQSEQPVRIVLSNMRDAAEAMQSDGEDASMAADDGDDSAGEHDNEGAGDSEADHEGDNDTDITSSTTNTSTRADTDTGSSTSDPSMTTAVTSAPVPISDAPAARVFTTLSKQQGFINWAMDFLPTHFLHSQYQHHCLVYLTAESPTVLTELDTSAVYVIGGLVDHNKLKNHCHSKATQYGLMTARLPLSECMVSVIGHRTVITVNQVFSCLLQAFTLQRNGGETDWRRRWAVVFERVLAKRQGWRARPELLADVHTNAVNDSDGAAASARMSE